MLDRLEDTRGLVLLGKNYDQAIDIYEATLKVI